jgi:hypothetical protein
MPMNASATAVLRLVAGVFLCLAPAAGCNAKSPGTAAAQTAAQGTASTPPRVRLDNLPEISGSEKIGWEHELVPTTRLVDYQYSVYVDDVLTPLVSPACTLRTELMAECSAKLPALPPGPHSLRIVVIRLNGASPTPSHPSRPLAVNVAPPKQPS